MFAPGTRVVLKLSGEALGRTRGEGRSGIDADTLKSICLQIGAMSQYFWTIVVGGGNFFRGGHESWCHRSTADRMGMLATGINGLALQEMFVQLGIPSRLLSCGVCSGFGEVYDPYVARRFLAAKEVLICVGGTGVGYITTDTASVLRACELDTQLILKGSFVGGVFDKDPKCHEDARLLPHVTYNQALTNGWNVMDAAAFTLAQEFKKQIVVFSILEDKALARLFKGELKHTLVSVE